MFGSIDPTTSPSRSAWNRSPSLSPSPPHSPFSISSSGSPRALPSPSSTPGILGQANLLRFLNTFQFPHHGVAFYKAEIAKLRELGDYELKIDFEHVFDVDRHFAGVICERQKSNNMWLRSAANMFLTENGLATQEGNISFINVPKSLRTARDALTSPYAPLVWPTKLFKGEVVVLMCSLYGSELCYAIIDALSEWLATGKSCQGKLTLDGILIMERSEGLKAIITQEAAVNGDASGEDKALDVNELWPLIEPFFTWGGCLQVFF